MNIEPKQLVREGYDRLGEAFADWARQVSPDVRTRQVEEVMRRVPPASRVLELGCGTGLVTTVDLARRYRITGLDISPHSLTIARQRVPEANFICADMASAAFPPASFDAVAAFYSIIHVPRDEHADLLRSIAGWLRPGGLFFATMGANDTEAGTDDDWLGVPMYWSNFDGATNRRLVEAAGLRVIHAAEETIDELGDPVTFLWIVAEKSEYADRDANAEAR